MSETITITLKDDQELVDREINNPQITSFVSLNKSKIDAIKDLQVLGLNYDKLMDEVRKTFNQTYKEYKAGEEVTLSCTVDAHTDLFGLEFKPVTFIGGVNFYIKNAKLCETRILGYVNKDLSFCHLDLFNTKDKETLKEIARKLIQQEEDRIAKEAAKDQLVSAVDNLKDTKEKKNVKEVLDRLLKKI